MSRRWKAVVLAALVSMQLGGTVAVAQAKPPEPPKRYGVVAQPQHPPWQPPIRGGG